MRRTAERRREKSVRKRSNNKVTCPLTKRFERAGRTVTAWARMNGFSKDTVFKLFYSKRYKGTFGVGAQIVRALHRDGFITDREFALIPFKKEE